MSSIRYRGTNRFGNRYVVYQRGYWYGNVSGSSYADDGAGHAHFNRTSGGGWHHNKNRDIWVCYVTLGSGRCWTNIAGGQTVTYRLNSS